MRKLRIPHIAAAGLMSLIVTTCLAVHAQSPTDNADEHATTADQVTARQGTPVLGVIIAEPLEGDFAEVTRVWPDSPAERAGLQPGDQIMKVGKEKVKSPEAVRAGILNYSPGDKVALTIRRNGETRQMKVQLSGTDGLSGWIRRGSTPQSTDESGWLGVQIAPGPSAHERGVLVTDVLSNSPAAEAGLREGDAILRVNKTRVEAAADLEAAISGRSPGETVKLVVMRDGEQVKVKATLGSFASWHGDVAELDQRGVTRLLRELMAARQALTESLLSNDRRKAPRLDEQVALPDVGVAKLTGTEDRDISGMVVLRQTEEGLHLSGEIHGLKPGLHGFHIHEYGDLRDPQGKSAGGHFAPRGHEHGGPDAKSHHVGDLGNIKANDDGVAYVDKLAPWLKLHFVVGRSIVVHAGKDDLKSQPSGDAGSRAALGVIGIASPENSGDSNDL